MAAESNSRSPKRPASPKEILFSKRDDTRKSRFGTVVCALWPTKPALNLAQRAPCTERMAQYYINGDYKPSAAAIRVVYDELHQ